MPDVMRLPWVVGTMSTRTRWLVVEGERLVPFVHTFPLAALPCQMVKESVARVVGGMVMSW